MRRIELTENGLNLVFQVTDENEIRLLHFSALPFDERTLGERNGLKPFALAELAVTGADRRGDFFGDNYVRTAPGSHMKYRSFADERNGFGRKLTIESEDEETGLWLRTHLQFYGEAPVLRCWNELENRGAQALGIEYLSSFALGGIGKEGLLPAERKLRLHIPFNGWQREFQWQAFSLDAFGLATSAQPEDCYRSSSKIGVGNTGSWSTKEYLPMAILENTETGSALFWQIEHNGSWYWEIGDDFGQLCLRVSGPTELHNHCWMELAPGAHFVSVPAAVGACIGGIDEAAAALTRYRRLIRRPNADNEKLPVIFNDYMNCLYGDPTTEKELPMIRRAAEIGCEYYVLDCGWYADGPWFESVGEWLPSKKRFPGGLKELMDYIRACGMVPGLWLEIEVMGMICGLADQVPDSWYFQRHGKRVNYRGRYQLDFRNPEVRAHASAIIDRLVQEYGAGYIKMDYNIEPGMGTDLNADSAGAGLLAHNRAYLSWLDSIFEKYPELVIENCSSGGMRIDYAMLSRHSLQSTSDQEDYLNYATIATNAPSGLTPEQAAVWSYPMRDGDEEETVFNMVNALLLRIHQSGHILAMSEPRVALIAEAIACYKEIRADIRRGVPFWPLGFSHYQDGWSALGLDCGDAVYLAVWRRSSEQDSVTLPLACLRERAVGQAAAVAGEALSLPGGGTQGGQELGAGQYSCARGEQMHAEQCSCAGGEDLHAQQLYPRGEAFQVPFCWNPASCTLTVRLPRENTARLFKLR